MKKCCALFFIAVLFCVNLHAEAPPLNPASPVIQPKTSSDEKEYSDAVVVLVDSKSGMIGLSWANEQTQKEEKISFKVDPDKVDVTNPLNQYLEFPNISVGDHIDLVTVKDSDGVERVVEIIDYNATAPD